MFQANQSFSQLVNVTGGESSWLADKGWLFGLVVATGMRTEVGAIAGQLAEVPREPPPLLRRMERFARRLGTVEHAHPAVGAPIADGAEDLPGRSIDRARHESRPRRSNRSSPSMSAAGTSAIPNAVTRMR